MDAPNCIIVVVGSNPLPNLLVVATEMAHGTRFRTIHLIHSDETSHVAQRLARLFKSLRVNPNFISVSSSTMAQQCRDCISTSMGNCRLDYTGGTKVMSANTYWQWRQHGGTDELASYVDDRSGVLRYDNGEVRDLVIGVGLKDLVEIHGLSLIRTRQAIKGGPTATDAKQIASKVVRRWSLANEIREASSERNLPMDFSAFGLDLSISGIDINLEADLLNVWKIFLRGGWLEEWIAALIQETKVIEKRRIHTGVEVGIVGGSFELDVVAIHRHRAHVLSATTKSDFQASKLKLFEAMQRSKQLGGSLARAAIVVPLRKKRNNFGDLNDQVSALEQTSSEMWGLPNPPRVFGLEDMKKWVGMRGNKPDISNLRDWLST
ncbi:MAG: hypothetical protein JW779_10400 [Candidatus Thorarchaeota archaeon]|nr:hypothetical protein [Candidatus Thorarchaeota archaeon]